MKKNNYYYLVSGLPEIFLEQSKAPFSVAEFVQHLAETLQGDDFKLVGLILLPYDNELLLDLLLDRKNTPHSLCRYTREELEEKLKTPGLLPSYMYRFYESYRQETPVWSGLSWENQLTRLYYEYVIDKTEGFLRDWFTFEQDLKNIITAINCRHFNRAMAGQLIGQSELTDTLTGSHARDFGLSNERPYVDNLLSALEREKLMEREKAIDHIKWTFIDEANTFHYFTIEVVLGYFLKLSMLERWVMLNRQQGQETLNQQLRSLEENAIQLFQNES